MTATQLMLGVIFSSIGLGYFFIWQKTKYEHSFGV